MVPESQILWKYCVVHIIRSRLVVSSSHRSTAVAGAPTNMDIALRHPI
jgi:hypothetical protein